MPLAGQQEVETRYKAMWKNEPLQRHKIQSLVDDRGLAGDRLTRTIASDFNVALYERFGWRPWFKIFVATGEVTNELVDAVNDHNAQVIRKEAEREPGPSRIGGARLSAQSQARRRGEEVPQPRGVQHKVTPAKALRREAAALDREIAEQRRQYEKGTTTMTWPDWHELLRRREAVVAIVIFVVVAVVVPLAY